MLAESVLGLAVLLRVTCARRVDLVTWRGHQADVRLAGARGQFAPSIVNARWPRGAKAGSITYPATASVRESPQTPRMHAVATNDDDLFLISRRLLECRAAHRNKAALSLQELPGATCEQGARFLFPDASVV